MSIAEVKKMPTLLRCWRRADFKAGVIILAVMVFLAIFGPIIAPHPEEGEGLVTESAKRRGALSPSLAHPFGTDVVGRDMLSRVLVGARYSLLQTALVVLGSLTIGLIAGVVAGCFRGIVEMVINYAIELFMLLPPLIVAAALLILVGPGIYTAILSLILTWWAWYARLAYVRSRHVRDLEFVKVSEALGFGRMYIAFNHVLPNVAYPIVVQSVVDSASVLLEIATINFVIGTISATLDTPDWGMLIGYGFRYITSFWWISLFPGVFLILAALGLMLVGDALSEESNPQVRRKWRLWF